MTHDPMRTVSAWSMQQKALVVVPVEDVRVIWSSFHQLFWRSRSAGYTPRLEYAGLYTKDTPTLTSRDKLLTLEEAWERYYGPERDERISLDQVGTLLQRDRRAALCWHAVKEFFYIAEVDDGDGGLALFAENPDISKHAPEPVREQQLALLMLDDRTVDGEGNPIDPDALPTVEDVLLRRASYAVHQQTPWLEKTQ